MEQGTGKRGRLPDDRHQRARDVAAPVENPDQAERLRRLVAMAGPLRVTPRRFDPEAIRALASRILHELRIDPPDIIEERRQILINDPRYTRQYTADGNWKWPR